VTARTEARAGRLAALVSELQSLVRVGTLRIGMTGDQMSLFNTTNIDLATEEAKHARHTITLSVREAKDLLRTALPPGARDTTSRRRHAMLIVSLRYALDSVRAIEADTATPAAIAAAKLAGAELRTWLRSVEKPKPKRSSARPVPKQGRLLLPIVSKAAPPFNRIGLLRHKAAPLHNAIPVRSHPEPVTPSKEIDLSQSDTTSNEIERKPRRTD
jgi:hypothetical protein